MKTPEDYLQEVQTAHHAMHDRLGYTFPKSTFRLSYGSKYIKLIENSLGSDRVHCFLDNEGNIYKAESWRKPAKGIRGHIDNDKKPLLLGDYYNYK
jgi:hypothetical protein